jgi:hypothetical protein
LKKNAEIPLQLLPHAISNEQLEMVKHLVEMGVPIDGQPVSDAFLARIKYPYVHQGLLVQFLPAVGPSF